MDWSTTSALLADLRDFDNTRAWGGFVDRFRPILMAHGRKSGLQQVDAEDLAQAALMRFAEAYRKGRYDRSKGGLRRWLFTITHRLMLDQFRSNARNRRAGVVGTSWSDGNLEVEDTAAATRFDADWHKAVLARCLERVRMEFSYPSYRAFMLMTMHGCPAAEAARELGISRRSVYLAKYRVLNRMAELRASFEQID